MKARFDGHNFIVTGINNESHVDFLYALAKKAGCAKPTFTDYHTKATIKCNKKRAEKLITIWDGE